MKAYKQFTSKKILIATILGVGLLLSTVFIISPLVSTMAQQQTRRHQQFESNETIMNQYRTEPTINGSVSIADNMVNFLKENTKIPFISTAETAQQQITNGTVLGGHLGITQGYLAYTYLVANPSDKTIHKVIIDAGNGQVLVTSEGPLLNLSFNQSTQGLDIGRDTMVSLEGYGIACHLDLHLGHHLDLVVIMIMEVLDRGNNFDDWSNTYSCPDNSIGVDWNFNDPY